MPTLFIDTHPITVSDGATILDAARAAGVEIPTICFRADCRPSTSCMVCVVKLRDRPHFVPACSMPAEEGMAVESDTPEVHAARRTALELLMSDHTGDCEAPCRFLCPAGMDIPNMLRAIQREDWRAALETIRADIPLPAVLGYVCGKPCEKGCRRGQVDRGVEICRLKRQAGLWGLEKNVPYATVAETGPWRVAVIGAGPAGIAAAYFLRRHGVQATIFEKTPKAGGRLETDFSETQLPRETLRREVGLALTGVQTRFDSPVETEATFRQVEAEFDAVVLACPQDFMQRKFTARRKSGATQEDKIFAAGSAMVVPGESGVQAARPVVRSISEGRDAAEATWAFLQKREPAGREAFYSVRMGKLTPEEMTPFVALADEQSRAVATKTGETAEMVAEAARCLRCDCRAAQTCLLRKHGRDYGADVKHFLRKDVPRRENRMDIRHPRLIFEPGKCIACGLCIQTLAESGDKNAAGLAWFGRGYDVRVGIPFHDPPETAIAPELLEACVRNCPTAAISLRE